MANNQQFFGNLLSGFIAGQQMAKNNRQNKEELKLKTKLYELQLQKLQEDASRAASEQQRATTDKRLLNINRDMAVSDAELAVGTGGAKSLPEALSTVQSRAFMAKYGLDPEKDFGIRPEPADIQELRFLQQNPDLAALDRSRRSAGASQVNVGTGGEQFAKPPPGFYRPDAGAPGLETEPGGPADFERTGTVTQLKSAYKNSTQSLDMMIDKAEKLAANPNLGLGVGFGSFTAKVPGTPGANVQADIESLQAQTAFAVLQAMRDASKTGGALGAISERELSLLESALAALSKAQSPDQYRARLSDLVLWARNAQANLKQAYDGQAGLGTKPPALGPRKPDDSGVVNFEDL